MFPFLLQMISQIVTLFSEYYLNWFTCLKSEYTWNAETSTCDPNTLQLPHSIYTNWQSLLGYKLLIKFNWQKIQLYFFPGLQLVFCC